MSWRSFALVLVIGLEIGIYLSWDVAKMAVSIESTLPKQESAVVRGMILGDEGGFSFEDKEIWRRAGLWHLMVASGSNLMWLNRWMVEGMASVIGRRAAIGAGAGAIWLYTALLGWPIALVRAAVLMSIYYWSQWLGRRFDVWRALGVVGLIIVLARPEVVGEAGFWLSMGAYVAVVGFECENSLAWWKKELKTAIMVAWWTWPVLMLIGGKVSLIAPLVAIASSPVAPLILGGGMVSLAMGMVGVGVGWWMLVPLVEWLKLVAWTASRVGVLEGIEVNYLVLSGWVVITGWAIWRSRIKNEMVGGRVLVNRARNNNSIASG
jgi:competence protein ComEC